MMWQFLQTRGFGKPVDGQVHACCSGPLFIPSWAALLELILVADVALLLQEHPGSTTLIMQDVGRMLWYSKN